MPSSRFQAPLKGDTLTEKRRPSMTKKGIKSCSCWHMLNWAPKRAKIKWKAIEKALAAGVSISKQSIQKHVSWAGKILLLVFWERSGKCTILLTTPSIIPRGRVFQISLAWNTKFKAQETRSLQTFLHVVTIYYSSKQEELCNQMPKKAVVQCKLVFPAQAGIPIHGFSLLPFLNLIFESNLCLKHFNAVRCHFLTLDRRYTSSLVDCFNGWELFSLSFF